MKTINRNMMRQMIYAIFILLASTSLVYAYPPDNAAVLYYRASLSYTTNSAMEKKLLELIKGDIGIDEEIKTYVQSNKNWIKQFVDAGEAPHCDWGIDYSEGLATLAPPYASLRNIARIVLVQAKIAAESTDYKRALDLCLSVHKAGAHICSADILISHLVGISLNGTANQGIMDILPHISDNPEILIRLRGQVFEVSGKLPSLTASLNRDMSVCGQHIDKEKAAYILDELLLGEQISKEKARIIRQADENFFKASKEYYLSHQAALLTAIELPYPESYEQLVRLGEKLGSDSKDNPNAMLTSLIVPAIDRVFCLDVKSKTHFNAIKTAIEVYLIKARTGKLPDALPAGLPGDLFSGKAFKYEKNADGFILICRGKDLSKDKIYEYEFKVKK